VRSDPDAQREAWVASARDQELRLILEEERAERRVARARARLERAYRRLERAERGVDRGTRRLKEAKAELATCQERRALGPSPVQDADAIPGRDEPGPGERAPQQANPKDFPDPDSQV
jgi:hypothetical protein